MADDTDLTDTGTVTIEVEPVNDAPSFTPGTGQTVTQDATGPQIIAGWASEISAGPGEASQQLTFELSVLSDPAGVLASVALDPEGTLRFTPAGPTGAAIVQAVLRDDGGAAFDGVDTSVAASFSITVEEVQMTRVDLVVAISDGRVTVNLGERLDYVILVANAGPDDAVGARIVNRLPASLEDASWTCIPGPEAACPAAGTGGIDVLVDIPAGSDIQLNLSARAIGMQGDRIENTATAEVPSGAEDETPSDNTDTDTTIFGETILSDGFEGDG